MPKDTQVTDNVVELRGIETPVEPVSSGISSKGMRAIQGAPEAVEKAPLEAPSEVPEHSEQIGSDSDTVHDRALLAAEQALVEKDVTRNRLLDARRHASEAAARATLGGDAVNLDEVARHLGMQGNNFPVYDLVSKDHVASVKTHWADDGTLNDAARQAYRRDFEHMLGWGRHVRALEQDGQNLIKARAAGVPMPDALSTATPEQAARYLRDHSILMVPDDHVEVVRADLRERALAFPETYFLPSNPSEAQIEGLLQRVRGLGLSSGDLRRMIAELEE